MTGKVKQSDFLLFLLAILAVLFFVYAYPRLYPYWAIRTEKSSEEILQSAGDFVESLGYDLEGTETAIRLEHNADQIQYLERVFGTKRANTLMTDSIPAFFWSVRWMNTRSSLDMSAGDSQDEQIAQVM